MFRKPINDSLTNPTSNVVCVQEKGHVLAFNKVLS